MLLLTMCPSSSRPAASDWLLCTARTLVSKDQLVRQREEAPARQLTACAAFPQPSAATEGAHCEAIKQAGWQNKRFLSQHSCVSGSLVLRARSQCCCCWGTEGRSPLVVLQSRWRAGGCLNPTGTSWSACAAACFVLPGPRVCWSPRANQPGWLCCNAWRLGLCLQLVPWLCLSLLPGPAWLPPPCPMFPPASWLYPVAPAASLAIHLCLTRKGNITSVLRYWLARIVPSTGGASTSA